tara:strand:- start:371 stop:487 length:117 start_codon:yes stop_codon:yes gene_type:complete
MLEGGVRRHLQGREETKRERIEVNAAAQGISKSVDSPK